MSEGVLSQSVRALINQYIDSVAQLEILLQMISCSPEARSASEIATSLRLAEGWITEQLTRMQRVGLIGATGNRYRFAPVTSALDAAARELAQAYVDRRVAVIGLIYTKPPDHLRAFSDAFRLRGDNPERGPGHG
jgi:hypothetical protein